MLLLDTSARIELFRRPPRLDLAAHGGLDEVVTCLPLIQELLRGFRDERTFRVAREAMPALPVVESPLPRALPRSRHALSRCASRRLHGALRETR